VLDGSDPDARIVFTEAFTPKTLIALMEYNDREAIETHRCRQMRRAVYQGDHKLITVGGAPDELFNVIDDPGELDNLIAEKPRVASRLEGLLKEFVAKARARRVADGTATQLSLEQDPEITERLRRLGYVK
jgi:hypothetical protein